MVRLKCIMCETVWSNRISGIEIETLFYDSKGGVVRHKYASHEVVWGQERSLQINHPGLILVTL